MEKNNLIKILIPIVALVVVFESIMLVSSLDNGGVKSNDMIGEKDGSKQEVEQTKAIEPVADFIWETETNEMKVGKSYKVTLNLLSKKDLVLDSVESSIYFDPKMVEVSQLVTNKETFGQDLKPQVNNKEGRIGSILWSGDEVGVGYSIKKDDTLKILSFLVTPKSEGKVSFDISTSKEDNKFATIIVETDTSKKMSYLTNQLEINITK